MFKFHIGRMYTSAEVESVTNSRVTFAQTRQYPAGIYSVVDVMDDYSQYDFTGTPEALMLVMVDRESVQPVATGRNPKMPKPKNADHVVMRGSTLVCLRCKEESVIKPPLPADLVVKKIRAFSELHADCIERNAEDGN